MVAPTVKSLHVLYPVHGGILSLSIQLLDDSIFIGVPLFFLGGLAQSWRIHDLTQVIERHTRLPTLVVFGKDSVWPVCSVEPRHDGPAVAVRFARGSGGNNPDSGDVLGPNAWLGNDYRPVGSPLGPWLFGGGLSFLLVARCSRLRSKSFSLFFIYHSCFSCFAFSGFLLGMSNTTDDCPGRLTISSVPSANHRSRSRPRGDPKNLYP